MIHQSDIKEHMEVLGSDGQHVGTVDHLLKSGLVKLTKSDAPDGRHHLFPVSWVERVDEHVHLNKPSKDAKSAVADCRLAIGASEAIDAKTRPLRRACAFWRQVAAQVLMACDADDDTAMSTTARAPDCPRCAHEIERACREASRDPAGVTLVAVSKTFDADAIEPVIAAGQRVFGENRVQEAKAQMAGAAASAIPASSCT